MRTTSAFLIGFGLLGASVVGCSSEGRDTANGPASGTGATASGTGATNSGVGGTDTGTGSTTGTGGTGTGTGSATGTGGEPVVVGPGTYALPPPDQCKNQDYVDGCINGDANSTCGGVCTSPNACFNEGKTGEPGFICPRFMLFADEMAQASTDDANRYGWGAESPFNYAVVGHDRDDSADSVDTAGQSPCCQCYQLVLDQPENQVRDQNTQKSTIPVPKPLIVQTFNTGATTKTFDVFLGGGGLGANNACAASLNVGSGIGYQYTAYPSAGQPSGAGVNAVGQFGNGTACKNQYNLVTAETLGSAGCQSLVESTCNQIESDTPAVTEVTRRSCIEANKLESDYHQNWTVYAKRVACPQALTEVTGCKITETLPAPDPNVTTAAAAAADSSFKTSYSLTTMQDCCRPTCAVQNNVTGTNGNHTADGLYNSFYTCSKDGTPLTEAQ